MLTLPIKDNFILRRISQVFSPTTYQFFIIALIAWTGGFSAQAQTIKTATPKIETHSGTLKKIGQEAQFPISVGNKDILHLLVEVNPPEARAELWKSLRLLNAKGDVVASGIFTEKFSGVGPERPVRGVMTSTFKFPVRWKISTRVVRQGGLFQARQFSPKSASTTINNSNVSAIAMGGDTTTSPIRTPEFELRDTLVDPAGTGKRTYYVALHQGEVIGLGSYNFSFNPTSSDPLFAVASISDIGGGGFGGNFVTSYSSPPPGYVENPQSYTIPADGIYRIDISTDLTSPGSIDYSLSFNTSHGPKVPRYTHQARFHATSTCCGASDADPVSSSSGLETYGPKTDLSVYNPAGPDVDWSRSYSNDLAYSLTSSSGMPIGWTHPYDVTLKSQPNPGGWQTISLHYPNGSSEDWVPTTPDINNKMVFILPVDAPYSVIADANTTTYTYSNIKVTWSDGAVWGFTGSGGDPNLALLTSISAATATSATPQTLLLNWASSGLGDDRYHLTSIVNQSNSQTLLSLTYTSSGNADIGDWLTQVTDCYGRKIVYTNGLLTTTTESVSILKKVSVIAATSDTSPAIHYTFGYNQSSNLSTQDAPLLTTIAVIHPNVASSTATATITYGDDGRVAYLTDGNNNKTQLTYSGGVIGSGPATVPANQTLVQKFNSSGTLELSYYQKFDYQGRDTGTISSDVASPTSGQIAETFIQYGDSNNPDKPTQINDALGRATYITYEPNGYGLVNTVTNPRGVVTNYDYAYNVWPFGLLTSVQETKPSASLAHPPITFTYVAGRERAGLVQYVIGPNPNTLTSDGSDFANTQTGITYNDFGDVTSVTGPGHNSYSSISVSYSYTTDGTYTQTVSKGQPVSTVDPAGKVSGFRYDARGNAISTRDASGNVNTATYNIADEILVATSPATGQTGSGQAHTNYIYTYVGGPLKTTDRYDESGSSTPFRSVTTTYGPEGEVRAVGGATEPVTVTYNSFYAVRTQFDGQSNQTNYSYSLRGLPTQIRKPMSNITTGFDVVSNSYALDGQLLQNTDGRGVVTNYTYGDPEGQLTAISYPASTSENVALTYDDWGRLVSRSDASGVEAYTYSAADALLSTSTDYKQANGTLFPTPLVLNRVYAPDGMRVLLNGPTTTSAGRVYFTYSYNQRGQLRQEMVGAGMSGFSATWSYFDNGWLSSQSNTGNGWQRSFTPNAIGQTIALTQTGPTAGGVTPNLSYGGTGTNALRYDGAGNMVTETAPWQNVPTGSAAGVGATTYTYDGNDRLTGENSTRWSGYTRGYGYDSSYSRTSRTTTATGAPSTSETLTVTNRNRFSAIAFTASDGSSANLAYTYDGEGNRTAMTSTSAGVSTFTTYSYDSENRLTQVNLKVGSASATNTIFRAGYRADGLRAWKESYPGGVATRTYFLYDGSKVIGEVDDTGTVRVVSTWGADGLLLRRYYPVTGSSYFRHFQWDTRGNIAAVTNETGAILSTPSSDGFSAGNGGDSVATFGGQVGGYQDAETGLILFQNRYYVPSTGTWLTRDPIGESGGINLYSYVQANPVNDIDPSGLVGSAQIEASENRNRYQDCPNDPWWKKAGKSLMRTMNDPAMQAAMNSPLLNVESMGAIEAAEEGAIIGKAGLKAGVPLFNRFYRTALRRFNSSGLLTRAARELSKHPDLVELTKANFNTVLKGEVAQNKAAQDLLRNIMKNGTTTVQSATGRYGDVFVKRLPNGIGARWSLPDGEFIGFIGKTVSRK